MKTFTLRELDRQPAAVLAACERDGAARIRRRDGRFYTITPETPTKAVGPVPDFRARMKAAGMRPLVKTQARLLDKLIAGE